MDLSLPCQKIDSPSYHGIVGGCRSQSKSKHDGLIRLPWKFHLHIYHSFEEKRF